MQQATTPTNEHSQKPAKEPNAGSAKLSKSRTSSHTKKYLSFKTCCGVIELTSLKMACLIGLFVTSIALLILAAIAIYSFSLSEQVNVKILVYYGSAKASAESAIATIVKATYSSYNITELTNEYNSKWRELDTAVFGIFSSQYGPALAKKSNETSRKAVDFIRSMNVEILSLLKQGNKTQAVTILESPYYSANKTLFIDGLTSLLDFVENSEVQRNIELIALSSTQFTVISFSLVVILPILITVFAFAINRDSLYVDKIRKANAIMLLDTMDDEGLRKLFRVYCEQEKCLDHFMLLEKIQYFRILCEKSVDEDGLKVEVQKYEVAFEIFTDFMEEGAEMNLNIPKPITETVKQTLDMYNNKEIEMLPVDLFQLLEHEVCSILSLFHNKFKQSLAFQKQMKSEKIKKRKN